MDPDYQRVGIGTMLQRRILRTLIDSEVEILLVTTLDSDIPAQKLYDKFGFKELRRAIHYGIRVEEVKNID